MDMGGWLAAGPVEDASCTIHTFDEHQNSQCCRRQSTITTLKLSLSGSSEWRQAREARRKMLQQDMTPAAPATL